METNRIDFSSVLAAKTSTAKTSSGSSGFADMLMGVMNHHLAQTDQSAPKAAATYTPRRRFDDYPTGRIDFRDAGAAHVDRRVQNDQSNSRWSVGEDSTNPGRGIIHRASAAGEHPGHVGCGQVSGKDGDTSEVPVETADGVDSTSPEQSVGSATSEEAGLGDSDTGTDGDQQPDQTAEATPASLPVAATTPIETIEEGSDVVPTAASSEAKGTSPSVPSDEASGQIGVTAPLPGVDAISSSAPQSASGSADAGVDDGTDTPEEASTPVTFTSTLALGDTEDEAVTAAQSQVNATTRKSEQELEEANGSFRRNGNARRSGPAGQGAPGTNATSHPQQSPQNSEIHVAAAAGNATATSASPTATYSATSFDSGLGSVTGVPGWNLHLAQGAAVKRADFVANLRQHLQNLPVHEQVALSIQKSAKDGVGSITLQLSPSELGRIHLKLDIDEENNVQAAVTVERPATLELLQRDMKALERALQEAGLKAGPGDLSFNLQGGDPEAFARDFGSGGGSGTGGNGIADGGSAEAEVDIAPSSVIATSDGYVDVQV